MSTWIDFKELRSKLKFEVVLPHYRIEAKVKGERAYALCPFQCHPARTDGKTRTPSLSIHLSRGIFQCFGCKISGNCMEFAIRMEGFDPSDPRQFREGALKVADVFGMISKPGGKPVHSPNSVENTPAKTPDLVPLRAESSLPAIVNVPLGFALKHLDARHPYFKARGFTLETVAHFGLGYCSKGLLDGRIAIPLHDDHAQLVAYAGRLVDDDKIDDEHPKYLLPPPREREGKRYEFHKSLFLYRGFELSAGVSDLIVVEGFPSVWWLWQHGHRHVVALMGSTCSDEQARLIAERVAPDGRIWVFPDGDDAGLGCAESVLMQLAPQRLVRWVKLSDNRQPTDCSAEELALILPARINGGESSEHRDSVVR